MNQAPRKASQIRETVLQKPRSLPQDPAGERIVLWRIFRTTADAMTFSDSVLLSEGQHVIGGAAADDIGVLYWVGIQVDNLARWGNSKAIQMTDAGDGQNPEPHSTL
ncbi:MAG: hypothetical protein ACYDDA_12510 [Acidiferrobacteraceae bacterium]